MNDEYLDQWIESLDWFGSPDYERVLAFLDDEQQDGQDVLPRPENMLNAFRYFPPEETKVVILGQDPYPTPGHAHGLAFSVQPDVVPLPKSLQNIYAELELDCGKIPETGCLEGWAKQGVLLLNTALSVRAGDPGSHSDIGWMGLINETVQFVSRNTKNSVFILWGNKAQSKRVYISRFHKIISSPHPSPLSAYRGFFGSRPFSQANEYLTAHDRDPIDWSL
jgi:uracil-DNA glycosylase